MNIKLEHPFWKNYPDSLSLYEKNTKMGTWISRVVKVAAKIEKDPSSIKFKSVKTSPIDIANDFRGSSFEAFGELLIKLQGLNPLIGIYDYTPLFNNDENNYNDYGVDGKGLGKNGKLATVQFKFRSVFGTTLFADKDHLHNFINASLEMGVNINDNENMIIITTADEVFYKDMTIEWKNKVKYIATNKSWGCYRNQKYVPQDPTNIFSLKTLVDNNRPFWEMCIRNLKNL